MTPEQITALAATGESETLEFKRTTGTRREAAAIVYAMLNQRCGQVLFGVTAEGDVVGQQVSERTIEEVSAEIRRIDPPAFPTVELVQVAEDREVVAVRVSQGSARPYQYRGTAYRRVGNTTLAMSADEYNRMIFERMHSEQRWENQPTTVWAVEDLDVPRDPEGPGTGQIYGSWPGSTVEALVVMWVDSIRPIRERGLRSGSS